MSWCYTATEGLQPYAVPAEMQWQEGEDDGKWLPRIGYQSSYDEHVGHEMLPGGYSTAVAIDPQAPYRYLVFINAPRDHVEEIWIPTFADWLAFLGQVGPAATGFAIQQCLSEMRTTLEKLFQAWHGHDAIDLCHECDPHGYARQIERRRTAREKKAAG